MVELCEKLNKEWFTLTNVLLFRPSNDGLSRGSNCSEFSCSALTMVVPCEIRPLPPPPKTSLCP